MRPLRITVFMGAHSNLTLSAPRGERSSYPCRRRMSAVRSTEHLIAFGAPVAGTLSVPLRALGPGPHLEVWESDDELRFGSLVVDATESLEATSRDVYTHLIADARGAGYPYFVRMWNYVGGINEHDEEGERYQLFCAGRHDAFIAAGYDH